MIPKLLLSFPMVYLHEGHHFKPFTVRIRPQALQGLLRLSKRRYYLASLLSVKLRLDAILGWSQMVAPKLKHPRQSLEIWTLRGELAPIHPDFRLGKLESVHIQGPLASSQLDQVRVEDQALPYRTLVQQQPNGLERCLWLDRMAHYRTV